MAALPMDLLVDFSQRPVGIDLQEYAQHPDPTLSLTLTLSLTRYGVGQSRLMWFLRTRYSGDVGEIYGDVRRYRDVVLEDSGRGCCAPNPKPNPSPNPNPSPCPYPYPYPYPHPHPLPLPLPLTRGKGRPRHLRRLVSHGRGGVHHQGEGGEVILSTDGRVPQG